jgi:membrane protease YdiL (CAAX protease family)
MSDKRLALLALMLVGLAPTASIFASFGTGDGLLGQVVWLASKAWMLGLPLWWHLRVDGQTFSWSPVRQGGVGMGVLIGVLFSVVMVLAWLFIGESRVDRETFRASLEPFGLTNANTYIAAAVFWPTIFASAGIFVLHHFFALWFLGFSISANLLACLGLFIGGAAFSWLYVRYRSIWIPYITHAMCDVVVFGVGYVLLFL